MDVIIVVMAYYTAYILINDQVFINIEENRIMINTILLAIMTYSCVLHIFKTYDNITRYETGYDYLIYVLACLISYTILTTLKLTFKLNTIANTRTNMVAALMIMTAIVSYRVIIRFILTEGYKVQKDGGKLKKNVLIIGAGEAATIILKTLKSTMKDTYNVVGLVDDNINKLNYIILF